MQGPFQQQPPDPGAHAMQSAALAGEVSTIATSMLLNGLSGLLVSEGLARLVREVLGAPGEPKAAGQKKRPETDSESPPEASPADKTDGEADQWGELGAKALKDLVAQGVAGRILALNTVNTYLSMATAEQLRRIGTQLVTGAGGSLPETPGQQAPHQTAPPPVHQPPPSPYGNPSLGAYSPPAQPAPWSQGYQNYPGTVAPVQPPVFHPWAGRRPW